MLEAIRHIALVVKGRARTAALFHDLFGARAVEREDEEGHLDAIVRLAGTRIVLVGAPVQHVRTPEIPEATAAKLQAMGREFISARSVRALYVSSRASHLDGVLYFRPGGVAGDQLRGCH